MRKLKGWFSTNENEEAVSALEFCAKTASEALTNDYAWRWVILSAHMALQGYMVTALRRSDGGGPISDALYVQIRQAEQAGVKPPPERLDGFLDLYKKIKKEDRMHQYVMSKQFVPSGTQSWSVRRLASYRNEFIHFTPKGWMLELAGLPAICLDCLEIIRFLAFKSGNILWHNPRHAARTEKALAKAAKAFQKIAKMQAAPAKTKKRSK